MGKLLEAAAAASAEHRRRVSTATLNLVLREAANWRSPPSARGTPRKGRIYYATQARNFFWQTVMKRGSTSLWRHVCSCI